MVSEQDLLQEGREAPGKDLICECSELLGYAWLAALLSKLHACLVLMDC